MKNAKTKLTAHWLNLTLTALILFFAVEELKSVLIT
jgi:hypothetical protein